MDRDTIPSPLDLKQTLPTGAAFRATWKMPAWRPSAPLAETSESGVRRLDIQASAPNESQASRESLSSTLRMEIGLPSALHAAESAQPSAHGPRNDPRDTLEPALPISPTRKAAFSRNGDTVLAASVQRVGEGATADDGEGGRSPSLRPTDPFGSRVDAVGNPRSRTKDTVFDGSEVGVVSSAPPSAAYVPEGGSMDPSLREAVRDKQRPWGEVRPQYDYEEYRAEYTSEPGALGRWLAEQRTTPWRGKKLALTIAAATGVFGMIVLFALGDDEIVLEDDPLEMATAAADPSGPGAQNEPHVVTPAPLQSPAASFVSAPQPAAAHAPAASVANTTEIASVPENAEILRGEAIIANTPSRVARPNAETDFLVRLTGYEAQLIRLGPTSPDRITVRLTPARAEAAAAPSTPAPSAPAAAPER